MCLGILNQLSQCQSKLNQCQPSCVAHSSESSCVGHSPINISQVVLVTALSQAVLVTAQSISVKLCWSQLNQCQLSCIGHSSESSCVGHSSELCWSQMLVTDVGHRIMSSPVVVVSWTQLYGSQVVLVS